MNMINNFLRLCLGICTHEHTYRERRNLHGVQVMHLVCERCGHATPAMQRTAREHRRTVQLGAAPSARVQRASGHVVPIEGRPRRKRA
jgi:hypothetical protein